MILRSRVVAALAAASLVLGGCATVDPVPTVPGSAAPGPAPSAELAASLTRSLAERDAAAFADCFAPTTTAQRVAALWYANLTLFESASFTATGGTLTLAWTVPGDRAPLVQPVPARLGDWDGRELVLDLSADPAPDWAVAPVVVDTSKAGSVILGADRPTDARRRFARALDDAAATLAATDLGSLGSAWNQRLVLDVVRDASAYAAAGGRPDVDAAVTSCAGEAVRIVVNPVASGFEADELGPLVLHEGVHAETRACDAAYPRWVIEGLAESVTAAAYPAVASANRETATEWVAAHGLPDALPDDFGQDDAASQRAVYALAQLAVDATVAHLGRADAADLLATFGQPDTKQADVARVTGWYVAALRGLVP